MAIILEQQQKPLGKIPIIIGVIVLITLGVGSYFIFVSPDSEQLGLSHGDATGGITKINKDEFTNLAENKMFTGLEQYPRLDKEAIKTRLGKTNPFQKL